MPMRTECKNFESRTYPNGDTVRKCNIDLAPDAPWRCPESCSGYERRLADEPASVSDGSAAKILDEAEDIVNAIGRDVMAEWSAEHEQEHKKGLFKRIFRRK